MRRKDKLITSAEELDAILAAGRVCHLALHDEPYPYVVPMNYGFSRTRRVAAGPADTHQGILYFHGAAAGHKIDLIRRDPRASFVVDIDHRLITADEAHRFTMHYRSVMGRGIITVLEDPEEKRYGLDMIMKQYSDRTDWTYPEQMVAAMAVFVLEIKELSGKQSPPPAKAKTGE